MPTTLPTHTYSVTVRCPRHKTATSTEYLTFSLASFRSCLTLFSKLRLLFLASLGGQCGRTRAGGCRFGGRRGRSHLLGIISAASKQTEGSTLLLGLGSKEVLGARSGLDPHSRENELECSGHKHPTLFSPQLSFQAPA